MESKNQEELIYGWGTAQEVANEVFQRSAEVLLEGNLVFAYRAMTDKGPYEVVVSQRFDSQGHNVDSYAVYVVTPGWSGIISDVKKGYITETVLPDLKEWKVDKTIIKALENKLS